MKYLRIDPKVPESIPITTAVKILEAGGLVVYPTDTAYGLGVDATNDLAVKKLYEAKGRDFTKPTHVVVSGWEMIKKLCFTDAVAKKIFDAFMPGPVTMILKKKPHVSDLLTAGLGTLGVRIPNNPVTKKLSSLLQKPFTTPSANRAGATTPYSIDEVKEVLDVSKVDMVLDAGKLAKVDPSTIVDISGDEVVILREGPISKVAIKKALQS